MGRIPKLVKERALKELKEQQMKEAALTDPNETHPRTTSCSSTSDRSIENDDPNTMETGTHLFIRENHRAFVGHRFRPISTFTRTKDKRSI